ncbi:MAG: putative chaperone BssE [Syntrophomonadaceae bacterium]|nr:putative chaperone BssE [Bacillota bacterium]
MRESFEHKPAPQEQTPPPQPKAEKLTLEQVTQRREKVLQSLEKARLLPSDWKSGQGKSRDEMIAALESSLEELDVMETNLRPQPEEAVAIEQKEAVLPVEKRKFKTVPTPRTQEVVERQLKTGQYITIGDIHVPICQPPSELPEWKAVPGKIFVSGGKKFSEVRFIKDAYGLTFTAKPGEPLEFSEKHRGQRLESIDTVLEGRTELKIFNEALALLGDLTREYDELNPDDPDYDKKARELAAQIDKFTDPETVKELLNLDKAKLEDVDDFAERTAEIIRTQQFLRSLDEGGNEFIPERDPKFKLTPYFEQKFVWFATLVNRQLGLGNNAYLEELVKNQKAPEWEHLSGKGMTVIVGPRGTGKNKLTDFYCAETNRPLFRYMCSPDKEERDLTYDVELSDGEVVRIPTRILTAVTTPNAVLELDELNLLRPNVAKFFNSLFDDDRTVFLNDQVIKAAPGVVFVGLMNPAEYDGVEDLPETIDDRSNIMTMGYPPFREVDPETNREKFTHDEALILKDNVHPLEGLSDEQFRRVWDYVINGVGAQVSLEPTMIKIIKDLKNIVTIADRTRQVVEAYKTRTGETRMERDISLRGTIEAARFYSENQLWEAELTKMPGWKAGWNAAQYAIAMTYLPHTETYRRGKTDRDAMLLILAEGIR